MILDPINDPDNDEPEGPGTFLCACGDSQCIGWDDDAGNIKLGSAWYAADCDMANAHPEVVREREAEARRDMWRGK